MYNKLIFILLLLVSNLYAALGQEIKADTSNIKIIQDSRIKDLLLKKTEINEKTGGKFSGFRVQIHFGSDRDKSKEVRSKFLEKYPDSATYEIYQQPNFKVRVGDFRTKLEAQHFLKDISFDFPNSFIVADDINPPKID